MPESAYPLFQWLSIAKQEVLCKELLEAKDSGTLKGTVITIEALH